MKKKKAKYVIVLAIAIFWVIMGAVLGKTMSERTVQTSSDLKVENKLEISENIDTQNIIQQEETQEQENATTNTTVENTEIKDNTDMTTIKNEVTANNTVTNTTKEDTTAKISTSSNTTPKSSTTQSTTSKSTKTKTAATEGEKGVIYLTFDDGPNKKNTTKILDILKQENVKATFFIVNYNSEGEEIVKREHEEGHAIGIHGYSHTYSTIYKTEDTYMNNLNSLQEKIKNSTGVTSWITRFPGGSSNTVSKKYNQTNGLMTRLVKVVQENGYKYYDWNVDSNDAGGANTKTQVYNNVIKGLSKNRPNVVLMHDIKNATANAIKDIIKYGKDNGYTFETITYDNNLVIHHNVNN